MTEPDQVNDPNEPNETAWQRKRRLAEIFGDGEQSVTSDELPDPAPKGVDESATDRWLKDQVPPHHG